MWHTGMDRGNEMKGGTGGRESREVDGERQRGMEGGHEEVQGNGGLTALPVQLLLL